MSGADWLSRGLDVARLVATWSKDPSTKCGAVILDDRRHVVGQGFNGFPRGVEDLAERYDNRETKYPMVVHAEVNAIVAAERCLAAYTIVVTHYPCPRCAGVIIQAGLAAVACPDPAGSELYRREPWKSDAALSATMLREAGVAVVLL